MKTTISLLSLFVASAFAFSTVHQQPSSAAARHTTTALSESSSFDGAWGTGVETGGKVPPLGALIFDNIGPRGIEWFYEAEIKNGRVAMVATIGYMIQKWGIHFPLYLGPAGSNAFNPTSSEDWFLSKTEGITFTDIANAATPLEALQMIPLFGLYQILFIAGWFELIVAKSQESDIPGNYGYDPLGFTKREGGFESEEIKTLRIQELKNGRLAMVTIAAWVSNDLIPGSFPLLHP